MVGHGESGRGGGIGDGIATVGDYRSPKSRVL